MSRTRRSIWSVANGIIFTLVSLSIGVITTPLLLKWLGSERFGTYRVLLDWLSYIALFELGISGALMARLAVAVGKRDEDGVRRLVISGLRVYSLVTTIMLGCGLIWVVVLPQLISSIDIAKAELRIAGLILLALVVMTPLAVFRVLVEARQRSYFLNLVLTVQSVITTALLLISAWLGWGLIGLAIAIGIAQISAALFLMFDGSRAYRGLLSSRYDKATVADIWSLNWPTLIFNISGRFGLLADNIVVAWAIGPTAVAAFFLTQRLASIALGQTQYIGNATWAGLVELHVQGKDETFRLRLLELTRLVSGLSVCLLLPVAAYNLHFIKMWVGTANYAGELVTVTACINVWFWGIFSLWGWPISGTGNIRNWTPFAVAFTIVNVSMSIAGVFALGLVGPLLGTLVAFLAVTSWAMPRVLKQIFGLRPWELWRAALTPLLWGVPCVTIVWFVAHSHAPNGWVGLLFEMMLSGLVGLFLWLSLSFSMAERAIWLARLRDALGLK